MNCIILLLLLSCCGGRGNNSRSGMCSDNCDSGCGRRAGEGRESVRREREREERQCGDRERDCGGRRSTERDFDGRSGDCGCGGRDGDSREMSGMIPPPWQDYPKFPRRDGGSDCEACGTDCGQEEVN